MSPEQARGKAGGQAHGHLGVRAVLYEMLTGRRAFAGDEVSEVLASVLAREPDWTMLPAGLSPVLATTSNAVYRRIESNAFATSAM